MPITYNALLFGGVTPWHNGSQTLTYSFLGTGLPDYYPQVDTNADTVNDSYDVGGFQIPLTNDVSMNAAERASSELAILRWNEVANINLVPGSTDSGPPTGATITGNGTLQGGLGGTAGFGEVEVPRDDDGSASYNVSTVFVGGLNFGGTNYTSIFVNTNGSISFGSSIGTFTPSSISGAITPMIAAFWADIDTRTDATFPDSAPIYVDLDTVNKVLTVTWADVGYFSHNADITNDFQMQIFDRGGGDFNIVFRYDDINWVTGDASGGTGGLGGTPARAGYSAGDGSNFYELSQSGNQAALLDLENTVGNTGQTGMYVF